MVIERPSDRLNVEEKEEEEEEHEENVLEHEAYELVQGTWFVM